MKGAAFNPITGEAIGDRSDGTVAVGVQPGTPGRLGRPPPGADLMRVGLLGVGHVLVGGWAGKIGFQKDIGCVVVWVFGRGWG